MATALDVPTAASPLVGSLGDFPVDQVLRLIGGGGRSGTFSVAGALPLSLVVVDGSVGPTDDGLSREDVVQAVFHLALVGDGDFAFVPGARDLAEGGGWPLDDLLHDVADRVGRWRLISDVLPSLDVVVRLRSVEAGAEVAVSATSWNVAVALDGVRRVRDVTMHLGGDAFATMEAIHGLVVDGMAEVVATDAIP